MSLNVYPRTPFTSNLPISQSKKPEWEISLTYRVIECVKRPTQLRGSDLPNAVLVSSQIPIDSEYLQTRNAFCLPLYIQCNGVYNYFCKLFFFDMLYATPGWPRGENKPHSKITQKFKSMTSMFVFPFYFLLNFV